MDDHAALFAALPDQDAHTGSDRYLPHVAAGTAGADNVNVRRTLVLPTAWSITAVERGVITIQDGAG